MTRITQEQYGRIKDVLPGLRGRVRVSNVAFLNAILHVAESGCPWPDIPKEFGNWHIIYARMQHWTDNGIWPRVLEALKSKLGVALEAAVLPHDSAFEEVPDGKRRQAN